MSSLVVDLLPRAAVHCTFEFAQHGVRRDPKLGHNAVPANGGGSSDAEPWVRHQRLYLGAEVHAPAHEGVPLGFLNSAPAKMHFLKVLRELLVGLGEPFAVRSSALLLGLGRVILTPLGPDSTRFHLGLLPSEADIKTYSMVG